MNCGWLKHKFYFIRNVNRMDSNFFFFLIVSIKRFYLIKNMKVCYYSISRLVMS